MFRESFFEKQRSGLDCIIQDIFEDDTRYKIICNQSEKIWFYKAVGKFQPEIARLIKQSKTAIHIVKIRKKIKLNYTTWKRKKYLTA